MRQASGGDEDEPTTGNVIEAMKAGRVTAPLDDDGSRRSFLKELGALGTVGLAGCVGGDESTNDAGTTTTGDEPATTTQSTTGGGGSGPTDDRTLLMNATQRFGTIDPAKGTDYTQVMALVNLYDPLVFPDAEGNLKPHLAESWESSDDNRTYRFTIRDDATFHSGNDVTADDVKFSFQRLMAINQGYSSQFKGVVDPENVTVEGEKTVQFRLNKVFSPFLATLVLLFVVDKKRVMANKQSGEFGEYGDYGQSYLNEHDAGSGAYSLKNFKRGNFISFEAFPDYWKQWPENHFKSVRVEIIKKDPTVRALAKKGKLDMTSQYQSQRTYNVLKKAEDVDVLNVPTVTLFYMKMNTQKPPTDDKQVRKAIAYGFDYGTALSEIVPQGKRAQGPLAPKFGVHKDDVLQPGYDPEKAKQILSDAGYGDGELKIQNTYVRGYGLEEKLGLLFQKNMQEIGIDVELKPQTWGTMTQLATSVQKTPHVNQVFYGPVYPSPDTVFYNQYHSEAAATWMSMEHLDNQKVDSLITDVRRTVDPQKREQIYKQLQSKIASLYPDLFVFVDAKRHAMDDDIQGYTYRPAMSFDYWFHDYHL